MLKYTPLWISRWIVLGPRLWVESLVWAFRAILFVMDGIAYFSWPISSASTTHPCEVSADFAANLD